MKDREFKKKEKRQKKKIKMEMGSETENWIRNIFCRDSPCGWPNNCRILLIHRNPASIIGLAFFIFWLYIFWQTVYTLFNINNRE
jgi:hypothetical protein